MNIGAIVKHAASIGKKAAPIVVPALVTAFQAWSDQKSGAHIDDLEQRIKDLEKLFKK